MTWSGGPDRLLRLDAFLGRWGDRAGALGEVRTPSAFRRWRRGAAEDEAEFVGVVSSAIRADVETLTAPDSVIVVGSGTGRTMRLDLDFWGAQGRIGRITRGPDTGLFVLAYPDVLPERWTVVVPSGGPGDEYVQGASVLVDVLEGWAIDWMEPGPDERAVEEGVFGWRPLRGPVDRVPEPPA